MAEFPVPNHIMGSTREWTASALSPVNVLDPIGVKYSSPS